MIDNARIPAAQYAIHMIFVKARWYVGEGMDSVRLYKFLDWAEILPALVSGREEDTTEEFRQTLAAIGEEFPDCSGVLRSFDNDTSWQTLVAARSRPNPVEAGKA